MSKYIKKFNSVSEATGAQDLVSPNVSYIGGGADKLLMLDTGSDEAPLEIKVTTGGTIVIEEKPLYFTIRDDQYQFIHGMTLRTWVQTSYNTGGWTCSDNGYVSNGFLGVIYWGTQSADSIIHENENFNAEIE